MSRGFGKRKWARPKSFHWIQEIKNCWTKRKIIKHTFIIEDNYSLWSRRELLSIIAYWMLWRRLPLNLLSPSTIGISPRSRFSSWMLSLIFWSQALEDQGGWLNSSASFWFEEYSAVCFEVELTNVFSQAQFHDLGVWGEDKDLDHSEWASGHFASGAVTVTSMSIYRVLTMRTNPYAAPEVLVLVFVLTR